MSRVKRDKLLQQLESVQPGLAPREIADQSTCFAFKDGVVMTFNEEIACRQSIDLDIEGAVQANPLMSILRKIPDSEVEITNGKGELLIRGKRRRTGIVMESDILLPIDSVETPKKWKKIRSNFTEAVNIVQGCAGRDSSKFRTTCIHIHPKWVEACDNFQMCRYRIKTRVDEPILVKKESLKHIIPLGITEFAETSNWIHFRNSVGLIFSCRRYIEEYPSTKEWLEVKGSPITLPKGIIEATGAAQIFSSENKDQNQVLVRIESGNIRVRGDGTTGWHYEDKRIKYKGRRLEFLIDPELLMKITTDYNECQITPPSKDPNEMQALKATGSKWTFVTCLGVDQEQPQGEKDGE